MNVPVCYDCLKDETETNFPKNYMGKAKGLCNTCHGQRYNPKRTYERSRRNQLATYYGTTPEEVERVYSEQNQKCAICQKEFPIGELQIDHCHELGLFRGLLCRACNTGLGCFQDNIELLENAIRYLQKQPAKTDTLQILLSSLKGNMR